MSSNTDEDFSKDSEWLEALEVEDTPVVDDKPDEKEDDDDKPTDGGDDVPAEPKPGEDSKGVNEDDGGEGTPKADGDAEDDGEKPPEGDVPKDPPTEEDRTKAAVKEALQEMETSKVERDTKFSTLKDEVSKTLYPEGIDRTLRDSDGDPITGIEDLTKLINPKTGDYFTDEEAGSWLLGAQQKLNKDVEQVERFIEEVAEVNIRIEEGANRVVEKYGDFLAKNPQLKDRLLAGYDKTLVKDPNSKVTINAPVDVEEFFDLALEPVLTQQRTEAEAAAQATAEAEKRAKTAQGERGDFKPSGKADTIPPEDKEWAEAIKEYEEGA